MSFPPGNSSTTPPDGPVSDPQEPSSTTPIASSGQAGNGRSGAAEPAREANVTIAQSYSRTLSESASGAEQPFGGPAWHDETDTMDRPDTMTADDELRTDDEGALIGPLTPALAYGPGATDPWLAATGEEPPRDNGHAMRRARHLGWELVQTLFLAAIIFMGVRALAQNFRVEGSSMEPGLHDGQYLLVNKAIYFKVDVGNLSKYLPFIDPGDNPQRFLFHGPKRGDVIVFQFPRDPSRDFIKRVIGVPGDTVSAKDGIVTVNGVALEEPYVTFTAHYDVEQQVVPEGQYFVLGDNRNNSFDSHSWGMVPEENIIGQAMFTYWPMSDLGGVGNRSINLGVVSLPAPW